MTYRFQQMNENESAKYHSLNHFKLLDNFKLLNF